MANTVHNPDELPAAWEEVTAEELETPAEMEV